MRAPTRTLAVTGLLSGALLLAACGNGDDPTVGAGSRAGSSSGSATVSFNDADVTFAAGMVPHHAQAVEMAKIILGKNPSPKVKAVAERIRDAQEPEIVQLNGMLASFGKTAAGGHSGMTSGMTMDGSAGHGGMMSEEQMQQFMAATGVEAERMFLSLMIEHHRGAVAASETEIAQGKHQPAIALATRIRDAQRTEIAEMQQLLTTV